MSVNYMQDGDDNPRVKPLDEPVSAYETIIAWHRGEPIEPAVFDAATSLVDELLHVVASDLIGGDGWTTEALAAEACGRWWEFMMKEGGGFDRYDGVRPFGKYAFSTLKWYCVGRDSARNRQRRPRPARDKRDEGRASDACPTRSTDRREVSLAFDPVDPSSTEHAVRQQDVDDAVMDAINALPDDKRESLFEQFWVEANMAEKARQLGLKASALHSESFRAREAMRRQLGNIDPRL